MAEAEKGNPRFAAVACVIAIAEARAMASAVRNVRAAGRHPQFWAAEMTYLERKNPELWGRRRKRATVLESWCKSAARYQSSRSRQFRLPVSALLPIRRLSSGNMNHMTEHGDVPTDDGVQVATIARGPNR